MARLIHVIHGEMRGSIAGNTFSRNKSGMIVRYKATPTQPNNAGQVQARANFGSSAVNFSNLDASDRQSWNEFATQSGGFVPLRNMNQGQFSGVNAFAALRSTLLSASQKLQTPAITPVGAPVPTNNLMEFDFSNLAPVQGFTPSIALEGTGPGGVDSQTYLSIYDVLPQLDQELIELQLNCNPSGLAGNLHGFSTVFGNADTSWGLMVYASEAMKSAGMRSKNKFAICLTACKPIFFENPIIATNLESFAITLPFIAPTGKTQLVMGRWNDFTVVAVNKKGQTSVIGTYNAQTPVYT